MTYLRVQHHCVEIHERSLFENDCIMNGFCGVLSPCKGAMAFYQNGRYLSCVKTFESLDYNSACFLFILTCYLLRGHCSCAWYLSVEIVCMSCSHWYYALSCLSKRCCPATMGVDYSADIKGFVKLQMCWSIAGRLIFSLHNLTAFKINYHHIIGCHALIRHA